MSPFHSRARAHLTSVVAIAACLGGPTALSSCTDRWDHYEWHASSADWGLPDAGRLDRGGGSDLLFHTAEEKDPWVVVDMLEPRKVKEIIFDNRVDCCQERGLPLIVELAGSDQAYEEVGRRTSTFDSWDLTFPARQARYARIRSEGVTVLHLREIRIP